MALGALILSAAFAYRFSRSFSNAAVGLAARAKALGSADNFAPFHTRLSEFVLIAEGLRTAEDAFQERALLGRELSHRIKNTLTAVQAIALQTIRRSHSLEEARAAVSQRLIAYAKAHDLLTRESWKGTSLHDIATTVATAHGETQRFSLAGPRVTLGANLALTFSLSFHELATNAMKYGALSSATGTVCIVWDVLPDQLTVEWSERDGPAVAPPQHHGFGSELITRTFTSAGGSATFEFAKEGLVCRMSAPIPATTS